MVLPSPRTVSALPQAPAESNPVVVAGGGVIGLSIALELRRRGFAVIVIEPGTAMRQASWAAAGMLAVDDPHHPAALRALARLSGELYADFLERVRSASGLPVSFQTEVAIEYDQNGRQTRLAERSIDPRQLAEALPNAVRAAGATVHESTGRCEVTEAAGSIMVKTQSGLECAGCFVVHASGAWFEGREIVTPRKGQIFRVQLPQDLALTEVHRRGDVYVVPRTQGPRRGTAVIGATVEDAGFDPTLCTADLQRLRARAAEFFPALADEARSPLVEAWVGFRPATPDGLPLLGWLPGQTRQFVATGHFRNGILLAPATAVVVADSIERRQASLDLTAFDPARFLR